MSQPSNKPHNRSWLSTHGTVLIVGLLIGLASIFRLSALNLIEFKLDEAVNVREIQKFFTEPYLMTTGPIQSTGIYNPPLFYYLLTIIALPSRDPMYLSFVIGLINVVAVAGFFLVIRRFYGQIPALFSSILLATSPWSILLSRKIWMPDLLWPLLVIYLYFLHRILFDRDRNSSLGLFTSLLLLIQMHASGLFLAAATIVVLVVGKNRINYQRAAFGILLGLIPAIPYIVRQFTSEDFCPDCSAFLSYSEAGKAFDFGVFLRPLQFGGGAFWDIVMGRDWSSFSQNPIIKLITSVFYLSLILPIVSLVWQMSRSTKYRYLAIFISFIPLCYFLTQTPPITHYFLVVSPFIFITLGLFWSQLLRLSKSKAAQALVLGIYGLLIMANLTFFGLFNHYLSQNPVINGDYGPVYAHTVQLVNKTIEPFRSDSNFDDIQSNAYLYAAYPDFYSKMGEYFAKLNQPRQAIQLLLQAQSANPDDLPSSANLVYLYIRTNQLDLAEAELNRLSHKENHFSPGLKQLLDQAKAKP